MPSAKLRWKTHRSGVRTAYVDWYDPTRLPHRKWVTLRTSDEGVAALRFADHLRKEAAGLYDPWDGPPDELREVVTVKEAVTRYLAATAARDQGETQPQKKSRLKHLTELPHRTRTVGDLPLSQLTVEMVHMATRSPNGRSGGEPTANTRTAVYGAIHGLLSWCVRKGYVGRHVLDGDTDAPRVDLTRFTLLRPDDITRIAAAIALDVGGHGRYAGREHLVDVIDLAVGSGLRVGEIVQLTWADVHGDGDSVTLTVRHDPRRGRTTKTGKSRTVALWPRAAFAIERLRQLARRRLGRAEKPGDPVVTGAAGAATFTQTLSTLFREYADRVGVSAVFHDLRHTYASWSVNEMAMPLTIVALQMGHADVRRTASYQRVTTTTVHEALARTLAAVGAAPQPSTSTDFGRVAHFLASSLPPETSKLKPDEGHALRLLYTERETEATPAERSASEKRAQHPKKRVSHRKGVVRAKS